MPGFAGSPTKRYRSRAVLIHPVPQDGYSFLWVFIDNFTDFLHRGGLHPAFDVGDVDHGFEVVPVNPKYDEILGQKCYPDLRDIPTPVDVVDLFQRADRVPFFVDQGIEIGARVIWMQLGVVNEEAAQTARDAGLEVVMDRCMKIEYARLFGGLNTIGVNTGIISAQRPLIFNR